MTADAVRLLIEGEVAVTSGTLLFLLTHGLWPFDTLEPLLCIRAWFVLAPILVASLSAFMFDAATTKTIGGAK